MLTMIPRVGCLRHPASIHRRWFTTPVVNKDNILLANVTKNAKMEVRLHTLRDNPGSHQSKTRVGRGQASGKGRTAGRGLKGQRARTSGNVNRGFEGGQTPHWKSVRKFGFSNASFQRSYSVVNLWKLQQWIKDGRIDPTQPIDQKTLIKSGVAGKLRRTQVGVKILGTGAEHFDQKITLAVAQASDSAIEAIQKNGGTISLVHYTKVGMRALIRGTEPQPYPAPPPPRYNKKLRRPMEQPLHNAAE